MRAVREISFRSVGTHETKGDQAKLIKVNRIPCSQEKTVVTAEPSRITTNLISSLGTMK